MITLLLDTCALIWLVQDERLAPAAVQALRDARDRKIDVFLSPITAWEVGLLVERGRLNISISAQDWFAKAIATSGVRLADMPPALLIESSSLPGHPPNDPGDRIIAATARQIGATLVTRDRLLLDMARRDICRFCAVDAQAGGHKWIGTSFRSGHLPFST